jgi:3-methylcrotonyl-CoA carboxylase beta subunit
MAPGAIGRVIDSSSSRGVTPVHGEATVKADGLKARGKEWPDQEREQFLSEIRTQYESQGNPYYATARLWDDGVIDPIDTRRVLGQAIGAAMCGPAPGPEQYGVFRM